MTGLINYSNKSLMKEIKVHKFRIKLGKANMIIVLSFI